MPIPKPRDNESREDFISRCMGDDLMNEEYEDNDQRYAICLSQWRNKNIGEYPMERKNLKFEVKDINEEQGIFEGYASTFTDIPDSYGDVVDKGAFKKTIQEEGNRIKHLWNHNVDEPIGKPLELREDKFGLFVRGKLTLGVQRAREILALMKDKVINEMSIGYDTIVEKWEGEGKNRIRHLKEVRLYDVSPVTFAANPAAVIVNAKAAELALERRDTESIREAVKSLNALLDKYSEPTQEPVTTTITSNVTWYEGGTTQEPGTGNPEAAEDWGELILEGTLDNIQAEIEKAELEELEARLDAAISKL